MTSPFHSIRWRVQLWHALILSVAIGGLCAAVYQLVSGNELRRIDRELMDKEREIFFALHRRGSDVPLAGSADRSMSPPEIFAELQRGDVTLSAATAALFQGTQPGAFYFKLGDQTGRVLLRSPNAPGTAAFLPTPATGLTEDTRTVGTHREFRRSADFGLRVVFGRDISTEMDQQRRFVWSLAAAGAGIWLVGLLGGWWLAGRAIRPIRTISQTATRIAEGNLDERIALENAAGELSELGGVLNRTFDRLHETLERQRQFTADAAHELRTPITILTTETQRILKRERSPEEYRAALETCSHTTARMRRLVEDLLALAREEAPGAPRETCDLAALARGVIGHLAPLAAQKHLEWHAELQPAVCQGQPAALTTVLANLIGNALQHHDRAGGRVSVRTEQTEGGAIVTVRDDGPGIAAADLPHIYDRFYRADKARTANASQHTGLGLAIVKTIVSSHGGRIECRSTPGNGATFTVQIPAASDIVDFSEVLQWDLPSATRGEPSAIHW